MRYQMCNLNAKSLSDFPKNVVGSDDRSGRPVLAILETSKLLVHMDVDVCLVILARHLNIIHFSLLSLIELLRLESVGGKYP